MDAIKLLKKDHEEFRNLFEDYKNSESEQKKRELFGTIKRKLDAHTHIEETIFYPAIREEKGLEEITKEGIEEHHVGDVLLREIDDLVKGSEKFDPKMKVLIESTEHHLKEEEDEMFPKVEKRLGDSRLEELGKKMAEEKSNFKSAQTASA